MVKKLFGPLLIFLLCLILPPGAPAGTRATDHMEKLVKEKDPHALWVILQRGGVKTLYTSKKQASDVDLKFCKSVVEELSRGKDYETAVKDYLKQFGIPKDWKAENARAVEQFKKDRPGGKVLETHSYHILSTADPKRTQELAAKMDVIFKVYENLFQFEEKIPYKCVIRFWKDKGEFIANGAPPWAAAYYRPDTKELVGYDTKAHPSTAHMDPHQNLFHEGWHQYFDYYVPNAPRWFDEGFAEVFSPTIVQGTGWKPQFNQHRSMVAKEALRQGRLIPLRKFIKMSYEEFLSGNLDVSYAQAWSFVYFLLNFQHQDSQIQKRVRDFYKNYFWELNKGTDPVEAVDIVFKDVNLDALEELWQKTIPKQK